MFSLCVKAERKARKSPEGLRVIGMIKSTCSSIIFIKYTLTYTIRVKGYRPHC